MKKLTVLIVLSLCANLMAAVIKPDLGVPLKDAAITRGPAPTSPDGLRRAGGIWYLTGTTSGSVDGKESFHNCPGARVWSSTDLKSWTDLGYVIDLRTFAPQSERGKMHGSQWVNELYPVPGFAPGTRARGMTAPRITFDGTRFWIAHSSVGYAAGAIPSEGADIKGPYINNKLLAEAGGAPTGMSDAQLFIDKDGTKYLVWGGGMIARMKSLDEMKKDFGARKTGEGAVGVKGDRHFLPTLTDGFFTDESLPQRGAPYGAYVFINNGTYSYVFTATTLRSGEIHEDSYICHADDLLGPYSTPKPFILDSGRCTVFSGPKGQLHVAYSDIDHQPVITSYPTSSPSFAQRASEGKPAPVKIVERIPAPEPSEKPDDVGQFLEMSEPLFDHPLRDAALAKAPGGIWYLTGTEAALDTRHSTPYTRLDWSNNRGIHLWRSTNLTDWEDLGYVWDCDKDGQGWHNQSHLDLTCGAEPKIGRAITAPEMHYLKGTFWIVYSMNGSGIGLLKSSSGKAEGPYEDLGRILAHGRDPSLFEDQGALYLVWGQGFYAKMKDDMTGIEGPVKALFADVDWYPRYTRRMEVIGQWGSHLVKAGDWYIWNFTARTGRLGNNNIETVASWSKSLDGPWGEPCLMLPNGGQSTLVADDNGKYYATVSGEEECAQHPYLPAITEVACYNGNGPADFSKLKAYGKNSHIAHHQAVNGATATELDYWVGHPKLIDHDLRDVWMDLFEDGYYYASGSFWDVKKWNNQVPFYRSKDKRHWEPIPGCVFTNTQLAEVPDYPYEAYKKYADSMKHNKKVQLFDIKAHVFEGAVYAVFQVVRTRGVVLKSKSMDGPFEPVATVGFCEFYRDHDGSYLVNFPARIDRIESFPPTKQGSKKESHDIRHHEGVVFMEDVEVGVHRIEGKYLTWTTDWSGSYDMNYMISETIEGPWRNLRVGVPHGGNGFLWQDEPARKHADGPPSSEDSGAASPEGTWWYSYFNNNNDYGTRDGNFLRLNMMPLYVEWRGDELIIEPIALRKSRARLEQLGAMWQKPRD